MCRLIETIRLFDGEFHRLELHERRLEKSYYALTGMVCPVGLREVLKSQIIPAKGLYKCRVTVSDGTGAVEFEPYTAKPVHTLRLVPADALVYNHKFADRNELQKLFALRESADDVLIVQHGCITDTTYANVAFLKDHQWFTPDTYLLNGTMRQHLLAMGKIREKHITEANLHEFERVKLFNAMLEWDGPEMAIASVG